MIETGIDVPELVIDSPDLFGRIDELASTPFDVEDGIAVVFSSDPVVE